MIACFVGCILGSLLGLLLMAKFDSPWLAMLAAGVCPAFAGRWYGLSNLQQLGKVVTFGAIGWMLGFMLTRPAIAESADSHTRRIMSLPLVGYDEHFYGTLVATLLVMIGVHFASKEKRAAQDEMAVENSQESST